MGSCGFSMFYVACCLFVVVYCLFVAGCLLFVCSLMHVLCCLLLDVFVWSVCFDVSYWLLVDLEPQ